MYERLMKAVLLLISISGIAFGISLYLQPDQGTLGILVILGAAILGAAGLISGVNDSYDLLTKLQNDEEDRPDSDNGETMNEQIRLHEALKQKASLSDLKDICFAMGVDHDNYQMNKQDFIRDLLLDMSRQNRLGELRETVEKSKPWILS